MNRKAKAAEFVGEGFNTTITGRNVLVTDAMKQYALDKISKIEKFNLRVIDVVILMDTQKVDHRVDIILKLDHILIKAHAATEDMYGSIDQAVNKIQTQIRRYRRKIRDHQAKGVSTIDINVNVLSPVEEIFDIDGEEFKEGEQQALEERFRPGHIVKKELMSLKTLTYDEAIMKMELTGDAFLLFRNEEDLKLKVIYRRDGEYGIIEPEV
jgi:putative sigma-54 modulation protein